MSAQANTATIASQIIRRKSHKAIISGIGLIAAGIGLYILSTTWSDTTSSVYMLCTVGGFGSVLIGILKLCFGGKETVYLPTRSRVRNYSIYLDRLSGEGLVRLIEQKRFDEIRSARRKTSGPVRLDVLRSDDDRFLALQVMQYVPYTYATVSGTYYFQGEQVSEVAAAIGNPAK